MQCSYLHRGMAARTAIAVRGTSALPERASLVRRRTSGGSHPPLTEPAASCADEKLSKQNAAHASHFLGECRLPSWPPVIPVHRKQSKYTVLHPVRNQAAGEPQAQPPPPAIVAQITHYQCHPPATTSVFCSDQCTQAVHVTASLIRERFWGVPPSWRGRQRSHAPP